jgi:hypothetical protein
MIEPIKGCLQLKVLSHNFSNFAHIVQLLYFFFTDLYEKILILLGKIAKMSKIPRKLLNRVIFLIV